MLTMTRKLIGCDVDDTLMPWDEEFNNELMLRSPDNVTTLSVRDVFERSTAPASVVQEVLDLPHFYKRLLPRDGAVEAVDAMEAEGFTVFFVSTPTETNPTCASDKYDSIAKHFGAAMAKRLILTHDKTLVRTDIMFDDKGDITGELIPSWKQILFDMPFNKHVDLPRITHWDNWYDAVNEVLK
jgi:5'(3')-deoxyribonucleotidase